MINSNMTLVF